MGRRWTRALALGALLALAAAENGANPGESRAFFEILTGLSAGVEVVEVAVGLDAGVSVGQGELQHPKSHAKARLADPKVGACC